MKWYECTHEGIGLPGCPTCDARMPESVRAWLIDARAEIHRLRETMAAEQCRSGAGLPGWDYIAQCGAGMPLWRRLPRLYVQAGIKRHEGWTWTVFADDERREVLAGGKAETAMQGMLMAEAVASAAGARC